MGRARIGPRRRSPDELRAAARDPDATTQELTRLSHARRWDVRLILAGRPDLPAPAVKRLLQSAQWSVRAALARRTDLSEPAMTQLAGDRATVLLALASNPSLPRSVAGRLAMNLDVYVAGVAAGNPATSPHVLAACAEGMNRPPWVLRNIATNPACPEQLRDELLTWLAIGGAGNGDPHFDPVTCSGDPSAGTVAPFQWYRNAAARTARPDSSPLWRVRAHTADFVNPLAFSRIMDLAIDESTAVRLSATRFPHAPALKLLADDEDETVAVHARERLKGIPRWKRNQATQKSRIRPQILRIAIGAVVLFGISNIYESATNSSSGQDPSAISDSTIDEALAGISPTTVPAAPRLNTFVELFTVHPTLAAGAVTTTLPDGAEVSTGRAQQSAFQANGSTLIEFHGGPGPSNLLIDGLDAIVPGRAPILDTKVVPLTIAPDSIRSILFLGPLSAIRLRIQTATGSSTVLAPVPPA